MLKGEKTMFQINCLNPISKVGLDRLTADYKVTDNINDAEGCPAVVGFGKSDT